MKRLFGKNQPGSERVTGSTTPQTSSTSASINGAPSADQMFLSELAVILSEEEEAKKRGEGIANEQQKKEQLEESIPVVNETQGDNAVEENAADSIEISSDPVEISIDPVEEVAESAGLEGPNSAIETTADNDAAEVPKDSVEVPPLKDTSDSQEVTQSSDEELQAPLAADAEADETDTNTPQAAIKLNAGDSDAIEFKPEKSVVENNISTEDEALPPASVELQDNTPSDGNDVTSDSQDNPSALPLSDVDAATTNGSSEQVVDIDALGGSLGDSCAVEERTKVTPQEVATITEDSATVVSDDKATSPDTLDKAPSLPLATDSSAATEPSETQGTESVPGSQENAAVNDNSTENGDAEAQDRADHTSTPSGEGEPPLHPVEVPASAERLVDADVHATPKDKSTSPGTTNDTTIGKKKKKKKPKHEGDGGIVDIDEGPQNDEGPRPEIPTSHTAKVLDGEVDPANENDPEGDPKLELSKTLQADSEKDLLGDFSIGSAICAAANNDNAGKIKAGEGSPEEAILELSASPMEHNLGDLKEEAGGEGVDGHTPGKADKSSDDNLIPQPNKEQLKQQQEANMVGLDNAPHAGSSENAATAVNDDSQQKASPSVENENTTANDRLVPEPTEYASDPEEQDAPLLPENDAIEVEAENPQTSAVNFSGSSAPPIDGTSLLESDPKPAGLEGDRSMATPLSASTVDVAVADVQVDSSTVNSVSEDKPDDPTDCPKESSLVDPELDTETPNSLESAKTKAPPIVDVLLANLSDKIVDAEVSAGNDAANVTGELLSGGGEVLGKEVAESDSDRPSNAGTPTASALDAAVSDMARVDGSLKPPIDFSEPGSDQQREAVASEGKDAGERGVIGGNLAIDTPSPQLSQTAPGVGDETDSSAIIFSEGGLGSDPKIDTAPKDNSTKANEAIPNQEAETHSNQRTGEKEPDLKAAMGNDIESKTDVPSQDAKTDSNQQSEDAENVPAGIPAETTSLDDGVEASVEIHNQVETPSIQQTGDAGAVPEASLGDAIESKAQIPGSQGARTDSNQQAGDSNTDSIAGTLAMDTTSQIVETPEVDTPSSEVEGGSDQQATDADTYPIAGKSKVDTPSPEVETHINQQASEAHIPSPESAGDANTSPISDESEVCTPSLEVESDTDQQSRNADTNTIAGKLEVDTPNPEATGDAETSPMFGKSEADTLSPEAKAAGNANIHPINELLVVDTPSQKGENCTDEQVLDAHTSPISDELKGGTPSPEAAGDADTNPIIETPAVDTPSPEIESATDQQAGDPGTNPISEPPKVDTPSPDIEGGSVEKSGDQKSEQEPGESEGEGDAISNLSQVGSTACISTGTQGSESRIGTDETAYLNTPTTMADTPELASECNQQPVNASNSEQVALSDQARAESCLHTGSDTLIGDEKKVMDPTDTPENNGSADHESRPNELSPKEDTADESMAESNEAMTPVRSSNTQEETELEAVSTQPESAPAIVPISHSESKPKISTTAQNESFCDEEGGCADGGQDNEQASAEDESNRQTRHNPRDRIGSFSFPGFRVPESMEALRQGVADEMIFDDFEDIKSSFQRLLATTSSTATTFSEVAAPAISSTAATARNVGAPALLEAGNIAFSSATAASSIIHDCRREIDKRKSERGLVVSFVQGERKMPDQIQPSLLNVTRNSSGSRSDTKNDSQQHCREDVFRFLVSASNPNSKHGPNTKSQEQQQRRSLTGRENIGARFEIPTDNNFHDPILRAAVAGAQARGKQRLGPQKITAPAEAGADNRELSSPLRRLTQLTASTVATVASVARPAIKEVRNVVAAIKPLVDCSDREEEVLILGKSADGKANFTAVSGQRVLSTMGVSFEKMSSNPNRNEKSLSAVRGGGEYTSADHDNALYNNGFATQAFRAITSAGKSMSGIASPALKVGSSTPIYATKIPALDVRQQRAKQESAEALMNPKQFMEFLANKLRDHTSSETSGEPRRNAEYDVLDSVFEHERKPSRSSSISSPGSPGILSLASDSDDNDDNSENSLSIISSPTMPLRSPHPAALLWDMVDETHAEIFQLQDEEASKPPSAVSFDLNASRSQNPAKSTKTSEVGAIDAQAKLSKDDEVSPLKTMDTHIEHPNESDRSFQLGTPTSKTNKDGVQLGETAFALQTPKIANGEETCATEKLAGRESDPVPATPIQPKNLDGQALTSVAAHLPGPTPAGPHDDLTAPKQEAQSTMPRLQPNSDSHLDQSPALLSARSADILFDEGDAMSISGYISLPSSQFHDNGSVHRGSRHARHRLQSPDLASLTANSAIGNASFSGSRRSLYSAKKAPSTRRLSSAYKRASSRRLLREDSVNLLPALKAAESGEVISGSRHSMSEVQLSGIRHCMSENNLLLVPDDNSEPSISFQPGLVPDMDDISGVEDGGGMLDLALMTVSSFVHTDILNELRSPAISQPVEYLASVRWRQLLSNWKHLTLTKALTERPCSPHYQRRVRSQDISDEEELTASTGVVKNKDRVLDLLNFHRLHGVIHFETKNLNGLVPHLADGEMTILTNFIVEIGSTLFCSAGTCAGDEITLASIPPETMKTVTADGLADLATSNLNIFAAFVQDIVHFASHNQSTQPDYTEGEVSYSVGIKSQEAIESKAQKKYNGDLLQVKDILRAQVTFSDEGSLVAGVLHLVKKCAPKSDSDEGGNHPEVVRVKNLFQRSSSGSLCVSLLPTGYRHILINVRLGGLLLAEIQFQLVEMFEVLGFEGYYLHREILELEEACKHPSLHEVPKPGPVELATKRGVTESEANVIEKGTTTSENKSESPPKLECVDGKEPAQASTTKTDVKAKLNDMEKSNSSNSPGPSIGEKATEGLKDLSQNTLGTLDSTGNAKAKVENSGKDTNSDVPGNTEDAMVDVSKEIKLDAAKKTSESGATTSGSPDKPATSGKTPQSDDDPPPIFDGINRQEQLVELKKASRKLSESQILTAIQSHAIKTLHTNPRDVSIYHCLHYISMLKVESAQPDSAMPLTFPVCEIHNRAKVETNRGDGSDKEQTNDNRTNLLVSKECLLRCLAISNQGTSVGMTGWLEYGAENSFGRIVNGPLLTLRELAYTFACLGDWNQTIDALRSLLMNCDQHQPRYHPSTLCTMLDLAGAARMISCPVLERATMADLATRLAFYLSEQEQSYFSAFAVASEGGEGQKVVVLQFENNLEGIPMLQAFVEAFESQLPSTLLQRVDVASKAKTNETLLVGHCYLADAFTVLANCILTTETLIGVSSVAKNTSRYYWRKAFTNYEVAFKGSLQKKRNLSHEAVVSAAYGMARCLRELGQRGKALQILSSVVSVMGRQETETHTGDNDAVVGDDDSKFQGELSSTVVLSFVPSRGTGSKRLLLTKTGDYKPRQEYLMALFLWLMAVVSVEEQPNERGRMRALSLLHAASESLRILVVAPELNNMYKDKDDPHCNTPPYNQTYTALLTRVEQEAKDLVEPLEDAVAEAVPQNVRSDDGEDGVMI